MASWKALLLVGLAWLAMLARVSWCAATNPNPPREFRLSTGRVPPMYPPHILDGSRLWSMMCDGRRDEPATLACVDLMTGVAESYTLDDRLRWSPWIAFAKHPSGRLAILVATGVCIVTPGRGVERLPDHPGISPWTSTIAWDGDALELVSDHSSLVIFRHVPGRGWETRQLLRTPENARFEHARRTSRGWVFLFSRCRMFDDDYELLKMSEGAAPVSLGLVSLPDDMTELDAAFVAQWPGGNLIPARTVMRWNGERLVPALPDPPETVEYLNWLTSAYVVGPDGLEEWIPRMMGATDHWIRLSGHWIGEDEIRARLRAQHCDLWAHYVLPRREGGYWVIAPSGEYVAVDAEWRRTDPLSLPERATRLVRRIGHPDTHEPILRDEPAFKRFSLLLVLLYPALGLLLALADRLVLRHRASAWPAVLLASYALILVVFGWTCWKMAASL
jgi:hypothetical protein